MKQAGYTKRTRVRTPERYKQPQRPMNGDNGETKFRGNPQQFVEKYLTLARDASSSGDPVAAENYYQYADHYYRISMANRVPRSFERKNEPSEVIDEKMIKPEVLPAAIPIDPKPNETETNIEAS